MPQFCILKQQKIKTLVQLKALWEHNSRAKSPKNSNPELHYMNEYMISEESYLDSFDRLVTKKGVKYSTQSGKNSSVIALEFYSAFTPGTRLNLDEWKEANRRFFEEKYGKENVISMIVHYDEHSPHIHTMVFPVVHRTRTLKNGSEKEYYTLSAYEFCNGPSGMRKLQEDYAVAMAPFGLQKGKKIKNSKASFDNVEEFYKEVEEAANFQLPRPLPKEDIESYIERASKEIQKAAMQYLKKEAFWKREYHLKELELENMKETVEATKEIVQWASSFENQELLEKLTTLSEEELEKYFADKEFVENQFTL